MVKSKKSSIELKISEADLERYGTDLLILDDWRSLKTDPVSRREWGKGFGELGMADHLYLRYSNATSYTGDPYRPTLSQRVAGEILWIEWKRRSGKAKAHQIKWIELERARGAVVALADVDFEATPEGFFAWYCGNLMRKRITPSFEQI